MTGPTTSAPRQGLRWVVALPLIGFIALAGLFLVDPERQYLHDAPASET